MIYVVVDGYYSDWDIIGYFNTRLEADKYCALESKRGLYVIEIKDLTNEKDLSKVSLKYEHEVIFDFCKEENCYEMREEPDRYECYISNSLKSNTVSSPYNTWINFNININQDNRKLAEKIAQDSLAEILSYGDGIVRQENIDLLNEKFSKM